MKTADNTKSICPFCQNGTIPNESKLPIRDEVSIEELAKEIIDKRFTGIPIAILELSAKHTAEHLLDNFNIVRKQTQPLSSTEVDGVSINYMQRVCAKHEYIECELSITNGTVPGIVTTKTFQCKFCGCLKPSTHSIKEEKVSTETFEQEAERLYPYIVFRDKPVRTEIAKSAVNDLRKAHIKARQMNDSKLRELIEWVEKEIEYFKSSEDSADRSVAFYLQSCFLSKAKELLNR